MSFAAEPPDGNEYIATELVIERGNPLVVASVRTMVEKRSVRT